MKNYYFQILGKSCACPCYGEGGIILMYCKQCNSVIGSCSELDYNVYELIDSVLVEKLNEENPYKCPKCGAENEALDYANENQVKNLKVKKVFV